MTIAFITRSTLHTVPGGDTIQVRETARCLRELGVEVDICPTDKKIDYSRYHLFHYSNITRPADILYHIHRHKAPFVVSPVLVDYSEFDREYRRGISGFILRQFSSGANEYIKSAARWIRRKDTIRSREYLLRGQRCSIRLILSRAAMILPNSQSEYENLESQFGISKDYMVVPNGVDRKLFSRQPGGPRDPGTVLCAARIEGVKNQYNLIRALRNTAYTLLLVGSPSPNQLSYYERCKKAAASNVHFIQHVSQVHLAGYYATAKVHALPSWFETCGLSSLEAGVMGCNLAISSRGYTRDYFGDRAFYCDPASPESIYNSVVAAAKAPADDQLKEKIARDYTWERAASLTMNAYNKILSK